MAVIIEHTTTGDRYVLLGAGYGAWAAASGSRTVGRVSAPGKSGEAHMVCVSNGEGEIVWMPAREARVLEIDRRTPGEFLAAFDAVTPRAARGDDGSGREAA